MVATVGTIVIALLALASLVHTIRHAPQEYRFMLTAYEAGGWATFTFLTFYDEADWTLPGGVLVLLLNILSSFIWPGYWFAALIKSIFI